MDDDPPHGTERVIKAFAWLPVRIRRGTGAGGEYVWLEGYWKKQKFGVWRNGNTWTTFDRFFREEHEPTK